MIETTKYDERRNYLWPTRGGRILIAERLLISCGVNRKDAPEVLQVAALSITDRDIYSTQLDNFSDIAKAMKDVLQLTTEAGLPDGNYLKEMIFLPEEGVIRPVFKDNTGADGTCDIPVKGLSGTEVIMAIAEKIVSIMK